MATTNTINGLITRINAAFNTIRSKAKDLELTIPAGTYWNGSSDSEISATTVGDSYKIDAVAAAINNITKRTFIDHKTTGSASASGKTVSGSYTILSGYYPSNVTVSYSASASDIDTGTAGSTTVQTAPLTVNTGSYDNYTNTSGTKGGKYVSITLPNNSGWYTNGTTLYTNIPSLVISGDLYIKIKLVTDEKGETVSVSDGFSIPAGYYPSAVTVYPKLSTDDTNKVVNIATQLNTLTSKTGTLSNFIKLPTDTAASDFDFMSKSASFTVQSGSHSGPVAFTTYNSSTAYDVGAYVTNSSHLYKCIKATTAGTAPSNTTYWQDLGAYASVTIDSQYKVDATTAGWLDTSSKRYTVQSAQTPSLTVTASDEDLSIGTKSSGYYPINATVTAKTTYGTAGWIATTGLSAVEAASTKVGRIAALAEGSVGNSTTAGVSVGTIGSYTKYTNTSGSTATKVSFKVGTSGYYTANELIYSNYNYYNYANGSTEATQTVTATAGTNNANSTTKTITIPAGYYANQTAIIVNGSVGTGSHSVANAPTFSTSSTYAVGAYVVYGGNLYKCSTAVTTAGAWDASKWTAQTPSNITSLFIKDFIGTGWLAGGTTYYKILSGSHSVDNVPVFNKATAYAVNAIVLYGTNYYKCKTATTANADFNANLWDLLTPTTTITTPVIQDVITAGWQNAGTTYRKVRDYVAGNLTINTANGASSLACKTAGWLGSAISFTIPTTDGRLGDGTDANANIAASKGTITASITKLGDLSLNTTFYATDSGDSNSHAPRFLSSFTVEVNDTIAALAAI